jgi:pimeloyl-ACP methyl ester carboxylesterase
METTVVTSADGTEITADFGHLTVPENRSDPGTRDIRIAWARLRSTSAKPATPVFYLEGGPGGAAVFQARQPGAVQSWSPLLERGDVVLSDQRGTGESDPALVWSTESLPPLDLLARPDAMRQRAEANLRAAREEMERRGADLAGYNTVESADDLDALREALGYEKVALLGFSYGTHLAIAYARRHEDALDAMVLAGVEGPDNTWKLPEDFELQLSRLSAAVAADPVVGAEVPDLTTLYLRVREKLAARPMVVELAQCVGERPCDLPIGPLFLDYIIRRDIGDASDLPVFPRLLHSIDRDDPSVLAWFVAKRAGIVMSVHVMGAVVDQASGVTPERRAMIEAQAARSPFGGVANGLFPELGELWGVPDLGDDYRAPLLTDVPTLLISGEWDWHTPPYQAEKLNWGLGRGTHLIVGGAGHEQTLTHPDIRDAIVRFLRGEDVSDVKAAWPPLSFVPLEGYDPRNTHPAVPRT